MRTRAFTLVELLVAVGIVAALVAVLLPVLTQARRFSYKATAISNLRQCYIALSMYCEDYGGGFEHLPDYKVASQVIPKSVSCDPADYWHSPCAATYESPLVGSFGYVRSEGIIGPELWQAVLRNKQSNVAVLTSIFHSTPQVEPFVGNYPPRTEIGNGKRYMPPHVITLYVDGSARSAKIAQKPDILQHFSWPALFADLNLR